MYFIFYKALDSHDKQNNLTYKNLEGIQIVGFKCKTKLNQYETHFKSNYLYSIIFHFIKM